MRHSIDGYLTGPWEGELGVGRDQTLGKKGGLPHRIHLQVGTEDRGDLVLRKAYHETRSLNVSLQVVRRDRRG